jgi:hypothetical protein
MLGGGRPIKYTYTEGRRASELGDLSVLAKIPAHMFDTEPALSFTLKDIPYLKNEAS